MLISKSYGSYNDRRYSRPWGARVNLDGVKLAYKFTGQYQGDYSGGEVMIEAEPGMILAFGQRDNRGKNTENDLYRVQSDGSLATIDRASAVRYLREAV